MIAIFTTEREATEYSDLVHQHLTANRPGYNATQWSKVNKSDEKSEWAVKLPPDLPKLKVKMKESDLSKSIRKDAKFSDKWKDDEKLNEKNKKDEKTDISNGNSKPAKSK